MDVSSCLATRIPHAAGSGYAQKIQKSNNITVSYFGEGSAAEGDAYTGMNFAAVKKSHTLFIVTNNACAISMPCSDSYAGDGIASKSIAIGIPSTRVDGSDPLAIMHAVLEARKIILEEGIPVMIELML